MAKFKVDYYSEKTGGAQQYASLGFFESDAGKDASIKVCLAGAEVLINALRNHLKQTTHDPNDEVRGQLARSIKAKVYEAVGSVIVGPVGKHHGQGTGPKTREAGYHRPKTGQGKTGKRKHHGMTNAVSAQDVGYYLEYGTPRMKAEHWMETTMEQHEEEIFEAMENAWNEYLKSKGL